VIEPTQGGTCQVTTLERISCVSGVGRARLEASHAAVLEDRVVDTSAQVGGCHQTAFKPAAQTTGQEGLCQVAVGQQTHFHARGRVKDRAGEETMSKDTPLKRDIRRHGMHLYIGKETGSELFAINLSRTDPPIDSGIVDDCDSGEYAGVESEVVTGSVDCLEVVCGDGTIR
jgi:hypothetical protein